MKPPWLEADSSLASEILLLTLRGAGALTLPEHPQSSAVHLACPSQAYTKSSQYPSPRCGGGGVALHPVSLVWLNLRTVYTQHTKTVHQTYITVAHTNYSSHHNKYCMPYTSYTICYIHYAHTSHPTTCIYTTYIARHIPHIIYIMHTHHPHRYPTYQYLYITDTHTPHIL